MPRFPRPSSRLLMPRLPAELTDRVIDHLHSDRLTLARCSLVCKTWLPASRYHLFNTAIRLTKSNINSFVELLDSPTSTFFGHALNVCISVPPINVGEYRSGSGMFDTLSHHLFRLKIKSLKLEWMRWDIEGEKHEKLFEYFSKIPTLELRDVAFLGSPPQHTNARNQFLKLITSFSSLEELHLSGISVLIAHVDDDDTIPDLTLSPLLRSVHVNMATHSLTW